MNIRSVGRCLPNLIFNFRYRLFGGKTLIRFHLLFLFNNRNIAICLLGMGATKTELFTRDQNNIAAMAKALAHPARIAILQYLVKKNVCITSTFVEELGLAQATVSQHLKKLKLAGIIQGNIEGASVCYCINPAVWKKYKVLFSGFFRDINSTGKECC